MTTLTHDAEALKTPAQFIAYVAERMGVGESVG